MSLELLDSLDATPRWVLRVLDLTAVALGVLALLGARYVGLETPEVILHGVWICLTVEAFLFGLRVLLVRIAAASVFLFSYAALVDPLGVGAILEVEELAVSDWPLMVIISIMVALMADRVLRTGRRYAAMYRLASDQLLTAQEGERLRLAQDLHDGVGQTLTGLILTLDGTERILWADDPDRPERGRDALHRAQGLAEDALRDTRDLAWHLRPPRIQEAGLVGAIEDMAAKAGRPIELRVDPAMRHPGLLHVDREIEVFRIVQEALSNAIRHAEADRIWIALERRPSGLFVQVGDDGRGFSVTTASRSGLGLPGMAERANVLHAQLRVHSTPGKGATVDLVVPWAPSVAPSPEDGSRVAGAAT